MFAERNKEELGELKGRRAHQKSWRLWEKIRTSSLGIIRLLHAVNMAHNYKSYGGIFDRNTHSQAQGEKAGLRMNMEKKNNVRNFIFYTCLLFSLCIFYWTRTRIPSERNSTELCDDNIFAGLSHSLSARYFVNFNGIWYASQSQANVHTQWVAS